MRKVLFLFILLSLCVSLTSLARAHGDDSHFENKQDVVVKTTKISGNVYLLQGRGGNIGALVGPEGILIVDDDYKEVSEKLAAALKELGSEKPKFIFNTHWHGDHSQGNLFFGKDSIIIAHTNVRKRVSQVNKIFGQEVQPYPAVAWPMITYSESMSVHFNGEEVRAVHYPNGHTDGDTVIFFVKSNAVHLGDDFFVGRFPFVDLDNGGSVEGLINNIASLIAKIPADAKLIPGHGPISTITDLKTYHQALIDTSNIIREAMKNKKTLDEIKKAGLPEKFKEFGSGFIKTDAWIETVYKSYSAK
jgi:glyoxylase-like metal-dependent hydrolase (beta-lactamase superfamily II)